MSDIICYAEKYNGNGVGKVKLILRSLDNSVDTGCRFKYIEPELPNFSYQALVNALNAAIDKEAQMTNMEYITDARESSVIAKTFDYDALMAEFADLTSKIVEKDPTNNPAKITQIVERTLGRGKKVSEASRDQAELISVIVDELKEIV